MFIADLKPNQAVDVIELEIVDKGEVRDFTTFRGQGRVANARVKDSTGECVLNLWNDEVDKYHDGQKLRITNGWCKEYRGKIQVSGGKYGKIEIIGEGEAGAGEAPAPKPQKKAAKPSSAAKPKKAPKKNDDADEEELEGSGPEDEIFPEVEKDPYIEYENKYGKAEV